MSKRLWFDDELRKNVKAGKKKAAKNWVLTAYDERAADNGDSTITKVIEANTVPSTAQSQGKDNALPPNPQAKSEKKNEGEFGLVSDASMEELKTR
ncbi:MAG: hypothetical protein NC113_00750 [Bacteroides sp.]|nr:hypothetical protein [Bacteroides sp.]MCM1446754.1 hypothetical protein [Bacteroides sp.]